MKLLSLFSGIGAFEKALDYLNIGYELVNYCEIDKYASKAYSIIHNEPESNNLGDITKVDTSKLPKDIDLISYGFPCQDISLAGKQRGMFAEGGKLTRSGLFFEALRIIEDTKPKVAIAENVKNLVSKKFNAQFQIVLSCLEAAGYNNYYQVLNAKNYGIPQNRERVFIVSIRKDIDNGSFTFPEPFELKLRLKDMLEDEVDEKYYLSEKAINGILTSEFVQKQKQIQTGEICGTILARDYKDPKCVVVKEPVRLGGVFDKDGVKHQAGSIWDVNGLAPTLDTMQGGYRQPCILVKNKTKQGYLLAEEGDGVDVSSRMQHHRGTVQKGISQTLTTQPDVGVVVAAAMRGRGEGWKQQIEISDREYANAITTATKDSMVAEIPLKRGYSVEVKEESPDTEEIDVIGNYSKSGYNQTSIVGKNGIAPTVTENHGQVTGVVVKDKVGKEFHLNTGYKKLVDTIEKNDMPIGEVKHMDLYNRNLTDNCGTLTDPKHNNNALWNGLRIRKLTPKECFRLMGFHDECVDALIKNNMSNTQLYKQAGNSIVVDVLKYIFIQLFKAVEIPHGVSNKCLESDAIVTLEERKEINNMIYKEGNKYKLKTNVLTISDMFDIEKLEKKEPQLFQELCEKYPLKTEMIYILQCLKGETVEKELAKKNAKEEPKTEEVVNTPVEEEKPLEEPKEEVKEVVEYPEDFQPLYQVGEELQIALNHGAIISTISIQEIIPKKENDKIVGYYYKYIVGETNEVKEMNEDWLVDHEVLNDAA